MPAQAHLSLPSFTMHATEAQFARLVAVLNMQSLLKLRGAYALKRGRWWHPPGPASLVAPRAP